MKEFFLCFDNCSFYSVFKLKNYKKERESLKALGWVLTKRERRKAGEDMETVSCKRKIVHIRAAKVPMKQNNAKKDTTQSIFSTRKG